VEEDDDVEYYRQEVGGCWGGLEGGWGRGGGREGWKGVLLLPVKYQGLVC
jgi:hypothetical protein